MKMQIRNDRIQAAERVLEDNGIDENETAVILQAIGYVLLDMELYPENKEKNYECRNI